MNEVEFIVEDSATRGAIVTRATNLLRTPISTRERLKMPVVAVAVASDFAGMPVTVGASSASEAGMTPGAVKFVAFSAQDAGVLPMYPKELAMDKPHPKRLPEVRPARQASRESAHGQFPPPDTERPMSFQEMAARLQRIARPVEHPDRPLSFDPDDYPFR